MMHRAVFGLLVTLAVGTSTQQAQAGLRVCNRTNIRLDTAIGRQDPATGWVSQGWWVVDPGTCKEPIGAPLRQRYFFLYGVGANGAAKFSGKIAFCIHPKKFTLPQARFGRREAAECSAAGLSSANFFEVDTKGAANHTVNLTGTYGGQSAGPGPGPAPGYTQPQPGYGQPGPPPPPAPVGGGGGGGGGGAACQRYPNLC